MAVLLPNASLRVQVHAHDFARDAHGTPITPTTPAVTRGPLPGALKRQPDRVTWSLRLDPALWPVEPGDIVLDENDRAFVLSSAELFAIAGYPDADYIGARATLDPPDVP